MEEADAFSEQCWLSRVDSSSNLNCSPKNQLTLVSIVDFNSHNRLEYLPHSAPK